MTVREFREHPMTMAIVSAALIVCLLYPWHHTWPRWFVTTAAMVFGNWFGLSLFQREH